MPVDGFVDGLFLHDIPAFQVRCVVPQQRSIGGCTRGVPPTVAGRR
jgi:hypothetical protein